MFERFRGEFATQRDSSGGAPWLVERLLAADGYAAFAEEFGGMSFSGGLYRVHDAKSGPRGLAAIGECFPEYAERVCPFGYDWLGRQFRR